MPDGVKASAERLEARLRARETARVVAHPDAPEAAKAAAPTHVLYKNVVIVGHSNLPTAVDGHSTVTSLFHNERIRVRFTFYFALPARLRCEGEEASE